MYESTSASILRFLAVANCIVGVIGSIIFSWSASGGRWGGPLMFILLLLITLLGVFLVTAICFTLADVADNAAATKYNTEQLFRLHEKASKANNTDVQNSVAHPAHMKNTPLSNISNLSDGWICKKCEDKNKPAAVSCRSCGTYK